MNLNSASQLNEFSEADTCREYVTPAIQAAGWGNSPFEIAEQRMLFTCDWRISPLVAFCASSERTRLVVVGRVDVLLLSSHPQ